MRKIRKLVILLCIHSKDKPKHKLNHNTNRFFLYFYTILKFFLIFKMECPICFKSTMSIFENVCRHTWCKECHQKMICYNHTTCPLCRDPIQLKKPLQRPKYIDWLVHGGAPYVWRTKRNRKRLKYLKYRI